MGRRLFWRIYLTLLASLVALTVLGGALWRTVGDPPPRPEREFAARLLAASLPPVAAPETEQAAAVRRIAEATGGDLALYAPDGRLLAATSAELPHPRELGDRPFFRPRHHGRLVSLPDGRTAVARLHGPGREPLLGIAGILGIAAVSVAFAAFPVARRLTRRLETLKGGVEAWGAGDLARRVPVEGRDEVAALARSFNDAAARIEALVGAHKSLLAGASHELRSPLARLRVGIEMFKAAPNPALAAELDRNLAELDALVDEVLLASRLDHQPGAAARDRVELLALAAEEGARVGAQIEGEEAHVMGDPALLRRLVRNLAENARRHGAPPIEIAIRRAPAGRVTLAVRDAGSALAGLSAEQCARLFEPFRRAPGAAESAGGWGLGLSLVRQIALRHGGRAWCEAPPEGGTLFAVELPAAPQAEATRA